MLAGSTSKYEVSCCLLCTFDILTLLFQQFANPALQIALHRPANRSEWSPSVAFWSVIEDTAKMDTNTKMDKKRLYFTDFTGIDCNFVLCIEVRKISYQCIQIDK